MKQLSLLLVVFFLSLRSFATAPITGHTLVCVGSTTFLTDSTPGGIWSSSFPFIATIGTNGVVTGISDGISTITYTAGGVHALILVTVVGVPVVSITSLSRDTICAGIPDTFYATVTGDSIVGLEWLRGGGYFGTGDTLVYIPSSGDSISFICSDVCNGDTLTKNSNSIVITVDNPPPSSIITGADTFCMSAYNNYVALTDTTTGGTWLTSNSLAYNYYSGSGEFYWNYSGTDTFYYIITDLCGTDTASHIVTASWCGVDWSWLNCFSFDPGDTDLWQQLITIDTIHYHNNQWQVGAPHKVIFDSALSLPDAIVTDTANPYAAHDTSAFIVTFPGEIKQFYLLPGYILYYIYNVSFQYELNIDSNSYAEIDLSIDSGKTWNNLQDSVPYDLAYNPLPLTTSPGWHTWTIWSVASCFECGWSYPYIGNDSLMLKFTFVSGGNPSNLDGWMIDNLCIQYITPVDVPIVKNKNPTTITLYPNPASTELNIRSDGETIRTVTITNILGQELKHMEVPVGNSQNTVAIDVSGLVSGVYFVKVNGDVAKKFLKE